MKKVDIEELKKIQIEILRYIDEFCKRNEINYWIDCGTLLGAVRHKGYIPWDDDIDIGMLRDDYDKFIKLFQGDNGGSKYICCDIENTPKHYYGFAKIYDSKTILYEPDKKRGRKISIYIDLFVYDNVWNDSKCLDRMYKQRDSAMKWYRRRIEPNLVSGSGIRKIVGTILRYGLQIFPVSFFKNRVVNGMKKYSDVETGYVGNFSDSMQKNICSKSVFEKFIDIEFEGELFKAPIGYDEWLRSFYGNYMELPPKEKQVSHHSFEAYIDE